MHTVNKAYAVLRDEGFVKVDRRRGAVIAIDEDKLQALSDMQDALQVLLTRGLVKNITREEVHALVDQFYDKYTK